MLHQLVKSTLATLVAIEKHSISSVTHCITNVGLRIMNSN